MYVIIDDDGTPYTGANLQDLIKDVKANGYGSVEHWQVFEATKIEVVESYSIKKPVAAKTTVKKAVAKK